MTPQEHYDAAERLLNIAAQMDHYHDAQEALLLLTKAQVHATLALMPQRPTASPIRLVPANQPEWLDG